MGRTNEVVPSTADVNVDQKKKKVPRRVLYFSDGILEDYSTDEDEIDTVKKSTNNQLLTADPHTLYWSSWFWYHIIIASSKTLAVCDFLGEKLAAFFGITTPKYEYEIDYYESVKAEEEEQKKQQDLEMGGWMKGKQASVHSGTTQDIQGDTTAKERY
ncbi:protein FAM177A1-like isoform X2 [Lycorma delicatula]